MYDVKQAELEAYRQEAGQVEDYAEYIPTSFQMGRLP